MNLIYKNLQCCTQNFHQEIYESFKFIDVENFKYLKIKIVFKLYSENNFEECIIFKFGTFTLNSNLIKLELMCKLYNFLKYNDIKLFEVLNYDIFVYII